MKKYAMYVGRWQTWHAGHKWLIDQQFQQGKNVWVAIRDVPVDENNPKTSKQVFEELRTELYDYIQTGRLMISVIPDIESINYGRNVGYDVIYHEPTALIGEISGTLIRKGEINNDGTSKKTHS